MLSRTMVYEREFIVQDSSTAREFLNDITGFFSDPNASHSLIILFVSLLAGYIVSRLVSKLIIWFAQQVSVRGDQASAERVVQFRRVETYLSVSLAIVRVLVIAAVGYIGWHIFSSTTNTKIAVIGFGTVFAVLSGGTIIPLLRDITAGSVMIAERWFNVGDYIRVEPFMDLGGVVEQVTLRSTRIRSLNGEVMWLHNQYMQGVRVTPRGIRTIHIDVFVRNLASGKELIERVASTIPTGKLTVIDKIEIIHQEQWAKNRWLLTIEGKTPPGREWLIEKYFPESLLELDEQAEKTVLIRKPIVRYADPAAERSFKRAVRTK